MATYDLGKVVGDKGETGDTGNGIASITKTGTSGLVDTYTITFTNGNTTTFTVTNGSDATVDIVTDWNSTTSDAKVPSEKLAKTSLDGKVDKVTGKGLSTNDFTNSYKSTIDGLSTVATSGSYSDLSNKPSIPSSSSDLSDGSDLVKKSSTTGLIKNDGSIDTNTYLTSSAISGMLTSSDIANNLTTTASGKVLDARQGKALADLIGDAIVYINS